MQTILVFLAVVSGLVAMVSLGRPSAVELSRRLSGWAYIVFAGSVLGLCLVADYQAESAWRQLELLARFAVGVLCVIAILIFRVRLKRDDEIEAGLRTDDREDVESVHRRQANPAEDPHLGLYRRGWACVGLGVAIFVGMFLTSRVLDRLVERGGPAQLAVYGVIVLAGILVVVGISMLRRYRSTHNRTHRGARRVSQAPTTDDPHSASRRRGRTFVQLGVAVGLGAILASGRLAQILA